MFANFFMSPPFKSLYIILASHSCTFNLSLNNNASPYDSDTVISKIFFNWRVCLCVCTIAKFIHSHLVNSPNCGKGKLVQVSDRSKEFAALLISIHVFFKEFKSACFSCGASDGSTKSGDLNFELKSRNIDFIISTFSSGSLSVDFVAPESNCGIPDFDLSRCSVTCPAVQLPSNGTVFNCSSEKDETAFSNSDSVSLNCLSNFFVFNLVCSIFIFFERIISNAIFVKSDSEKINTNYCCLLFAGL